LAAARCGRNAAPVEFTLEVVRDPTGCNTNPTYGLTSAQPTVSVYRRPRVVANTKYLTHNNFGVGPFIAKSGLPAVRDPDTGLPTSMNMMSDARATTLKVQAVDAARTHLGLPPGTLSPETLRALVAFEEQIYSAQTRDLAAGDLTSDAPGFGPRNLAAEPAGVLGNNTTRWVFPIGDSWREAAAGTGGDAPQEARAAIARGHDVFMFRTFFIRDSMHLNSVGLGNPVKRTCSTCHGMHMTGMDVANGWMDIGTTNLPWAREAPLNPWTKDAPQLPLFKITCNADVRAASVLRTRHLHAGSRTRVDLRQVQRRRGDRHAAIPRPRGARAIFLERLRRDAARARRLLRSALLDRLLGAGEARSRRIPGGAMKGTRAAWLLAALSAASLAAEEPTARRNFVACPIVRDTASVPCWLAEYQGELYFLTLQTDVSSPVTPPWLGHRVLVEGTAAPTGRASAAASC
jgi:hypothetical protein